MYNKRWGIKTFFDFYKNIIGLNNVIIGGDLSIIRTEFINMTSTIISLKLKKKFVEKKLDIKYSFLQIMNYLDQIKPRIYIKNICNNNDTVVVFFNKSSVYVYYIYIPLSISDKKINNRKTT